MQLCFPAFPKGVQRCRQTGLPGERILWVSCHSGDLQLVMKPGESTPQMTLHLDAAVQGFMGNNYNLELGMENDCEPVKIL